jgi:mRNA interferase HigB
MVIISKTRLRHYWKRHPSAEPSLREWYLRTRRAEWKSVAEVRGDFPAVDFVRASSGNQLAVFDIAHNRFRLISSVWFRAKRVYVLRLFSHAEYDRKDWKSQL